MSLLTDLVWWWDLASADATITDQQSGLALTKGGTATTSATGAPDGGACIDLGTAAGWYTNASVARTIDTNAAFSLNIWSYATAFSASANFLLTHRSGVASSIHWQLYSGYDGTDVADGSGTLRSAVKTPAASINAWHMLTVVADPSLLTLYIDGASAGTGNAALGTRPTAAAPMAIGTGSWSLGAANLTHRGRVAMAGVWGRGLTTDEITSLYNGGSGLRYSALASVQQSRRRRQSVSGGVL